MAVAADVVVAVAARPLPSPSLTPWPSLSTLPRGRGRRHSHRRRHDRGRGRPRQRGRVAVSASFSSVSVSHLMSLFSGSFPPHTFPYRRSLLPRSPTISQGPSSTLPTHGRAPQGFSSLFVRFSCFWKSLQHSSCLVWLLVVASSLFTPCCSTVSWRFAHGFGSRDAPLPAFRWRRSEHDLEWMRLGGGVCGEVRDGNDGVGEERRHLQQ